MCGELTQTERQQLAKLIAQQDELMKKLDEVKKNAAKNNAAMKAGIKRMRKTSRKIRQSRNTVAGFAGVFFAAHFLYDWLWGQHWWWGPWGGWCPGFIGINIEIWDVWADGYDYDWDYDDDWDLVDAHVDTGDLCLDNLDIDDADLASSDHS